MRTAIVLVVLAACGKGDGANETKTTDGSGAATSKPGEPMKPAAGLEKLSVVVDGKPLPMGRAFIKRVSADHWRLQFGDRQGSCEELLSGATTVHPGATIFLATIRTVLAPDGKEETAITELWSGRPTKTSATATIGGPVTKDAKVPIELGKIVDVDGKRRTEISGSFTAVGCGDQPENGAGVPKTQHVSAAYITVAGKKLELKGAVLHGSDVVLSTGPKDCSTVTPFSHIVLQHLEGKWELSGTMIADPQTSVDKSASDTMRDIKLATKATSGTTADGPVVSLQLGGSGAVGKYPILLEGTIEALDCPAP